MCSQCFASPPMCNYGNATPALALPRLLYLADVPVEASCHGSALLYRLLQRYPDGKLCIIESTSRTSQPERRLPGVRYAEFSFGTGRWLNTRFHRWATSWLAHQASNRAETIAGFLDDFQPDSVLTVAHGYGWLTAAEYARRRGLPLHLIVHDDWPRVAAVLPWFYAWLDRQFGQIYRRATSRLCVSTFMREDYAGRYGVEGTVLYPSRAQDCPDFTVPPERLGRAGGTFTCAYAGSINSEGYARVLRLLAAILAEVSGRLLIFGPSHPVELERFGLRLPNVEMRGLVTFWNLINCCRAEADFLFVPMSFDRQDRANMELSFPSKLADYTAAGLPLLICGPPYCSATRWAKENLGVAEVIESEAGPALREAVRRLAGNPARRMGLARCALELGRQYFAHTAAREIFYGALVGEKVQACSSSA